MAVSFRCASYADLQRITPDEGLKGAWESIMQFPRQDVEALFEASPAWTAVDEQRILALGGVLPTGAMWLLLTYGLRRGEMIPIFRKSRCVIDRWVQTFGQDAWAHIDESDPNRVRLAKMLGLFKFGEGVWVKHAAVS